MGEPPAPEYQGEGGAVHRAEAMRYFTRLMEAMADAVIATDAEFRVTLWNPGAERLYELRARLPIAMKPGASGAESIGATAARSACWKHSS